MPNKIFDEFHGQFIKKDGVCYKYVGENFTGAANADNTSIDTYDGCIACDNGTTPPPILFPDLPTTTFPPGPTLPPGVVCSIEYVNCTNLNDLVYLNPMYFGLGCSLGGAPDYIKVGNWCYSKKSLSDKPYQELVYAPVTSCNDEQCPSPCSVKYAHCTIPNKFEFLSLNKLNCNLDLAPNSIRIGTDCYIKVAGVAAFPTIVDYDIILDCNDNACINYCTAEYVNCVDPADKEYLDVIAIRGACDLGEVSEYILYNNKCYVVSRLTSIAPTINNYGFISSCDDSQCPDSCTAEYTNCIDPGDKRYLGMAQFGTADEPNLGCISLGQANVPFTINIDGHCFTRTNWPDETPADINNWSPATDCEDEYCNNCTAEYVNCIDSSDKRYLGMAQFGEMGCISLGQAGVPTNILVDGNCYQYSNWPLDQLADIDNWAPIDDCDHSVCPTTAVPTTTMTPTTLAPTTVAPTDVPTTAPPLA